MKKYIKFLIIICIVGVCICGCNKQEETTPLTIYEQLKITDRPLSEADSGVIQEGITNWVKSFLAINSDTSDIPLFSLISFHRFFIILSPIHI